MGLVERIRNNIRARFAAYDAETDRLHDTATEQFEHGASEYGVDTSKVAVRRRRFRILRAFLGR